MRDSGSPEEGRECSQQANQENFLEELALELSFEGQVSIIHVERGVWMCEGGRDALYSVLSNRKPLAIYHFIRC